MDPGTLEPLPVERLLDGLSAQLIGDFTSAAEQDQSLKQPFLEQLVPALSVGDFPEKELLTSSSWRMSDLTGAASIIAMTIVSQALRRRGISWTHECEHMTTVTLRCVATNCTSL